MLTWRIRLAFSQPGVVERNARRVVGRFLCDRYGGRRVKAQLNQDEPQAYRLLGVARPRHGRDGAAPRDRRRAPECHSSEQIAAVRFTATDDTTNVAAAVSQSSVLAHPQDRNPVVQAHAPSGRDRSPSARRTAASATPPVKASGRRRSSASGRSHQREARISA